MDEQEQACHQINGDFLLNPDEEFSHQHIVNAYAAQGATEPTKPITLAFALVGLYLQIEHGFTGRQIQKLHGDLARQKRAWPTFALPTDRGQITAADVTKTAPGPERLKAIDEWCASVWAAYASAHEAVRALAAEYGIAAQANPRSK